MTFENPKTLREARFQDLAGGAGRQVGGFLGHINSIIPI